MIQVNHGHNGRVNSLAATPNGNLIISAGQDTTVRVWHTKHGTCNHVLRGHLKSVKDVTVTSDNHVVISASKDNTLKSWDLNTGECLQTFSGHSSSVNAVVVSTDDAYIFSASNNGDLRQWDIVSGECLQVFKRHPSWWDRDGLNSLISSSNSEFSYHDVIGHLGFAKTYNDENMEFFGHADPIQAISITPNGRYLISGGDDNTVRLWKINSGECFWIFGGADGGSDFGISDVKLTPNGRYVFSLSNNLQSWRVTSKKIRRFFWRIIDEKPHRRFRGPKVLFSKMEITQDGRRILVLENDGNQIGVYKLRTGKLLQSIDNLPIRVHSIAASSDGRFVITGDSEGSILSWKLY